MEIWSELKNINNLLTKLLNIDPNNITILVLFVCFVLIICGFLFKKLRDVAPTLMVSAGIIGTFWGTFIALGNFQTLGVEGDLDHKAMVESIPAVLKGMTTAFVTTLIGLLFAFVSKLIFKVMPEPEPETLPIEEETTKLLEKIKDGLYSTDGKPLSSQITDGFKQLDGRMEGLAEAIQNSLVGSLEELMKELREIIVNQLVTQLEKTNNLLREQLSDMLERIEEALIKQFGETFKQFNEATQAIKKWQEDHRQQVEQLTEAFKITAVGIERIRTDCESIPETMNQLKTLMGELDERLQAFADMKKTAEQSFPVIKEHLDAIGSDLQKSAGGFSGLEETIRETYKQAAELARQHIEIAQQHTEKVGSQITRTTEQIEAASQNMMENSKAASHQYQKMIQEMLEAVKRESENMIAETRNASNQSRESMKNIVDAVQRASDSCVERTGDALTKMVEDNTQKTIDAMESIAETWGKNMMGIADRMAQVVNNQQQ